MATNEAPPSQPDGQTEPTHILAWLHARQKPITIALGAVFVVGLVTWYVTESGRRKQAQAMEALDQARVAMESGAYPEASAALQKVTQTYSGTDAAYEAVLALNQVRMLSGQAQLAVDELKKFVASNPPGAFGSAAHAHLAMALENAGKTADATAEYLKAAESAPEPFRQIDALLNAARTYRVLGKDKDAAGVLEGLIKKYPKEQAGVAEAQVRLAEITKGQS